MILDSNHWKTFKIRDLFVMYNGKGITKEEIECNPGDFPAIQSGEDNNGCIGKIDKAYCIDMGYTYTDLPCLTVARSGSAGYVAYQPSGCVVGDSAKILILKNPAKRKEQIYLFLKTILMANRYKYTYGRKVTEEKYLSEEINLPATPDGTPDWNFMEQYIESLNYRPLTTANGEGRANHTLGVDSWKEYRIGNLFSQIYRAETHVKTDLEFKTNPFPDSIPFISRTEADNGCDCYVSRLGLSGVEEGNAIVIGDTTATCTYQQRPFVCGDHIVVCRASWINVYTALFVITLLNAEKYRYSYGRAFKMQLIFETMICLPSTEGGEPDWTLIENYMKSLPYGDRI